MTKITEPTGDLNFTRFAELLEDEAGLDRGTGANVLHAALDIAARHVAAGHRIRLTNFGSFWTQIRRVGPTGLPHKRAEGIRLPAVARIVRFKASGMFADAVKNAEPVTTLRKRPKGFAGED